MRKLSKTFVYCESSFKDCESSARPSFLAKLNYRMRKLSKAFIYFESSTKADKSLAKLIFFAKV